MKNKFFILLFAIVASSNYLLADAVPTGGVEIDGLYYNLYEHNGSYTAEVVSKSYDKNHKENNEDWDLEIANIPSSVTHKPATDTIYRSYVVSSIMPSAFEGCANLTTVVIPKSVTYLGNRAFERCRSLKTIVLPNTIDEIDTYLFRDCSSLTSVTIPNSVKNIRVGAFYGCSSLTSLTIGNRVKSIDYDAFRDCTSLIAINIPNSVTSIGSSVFSGCIGLTSVTIPNSVTSIGNSAFSGCTSLTSITIPSSVVSLGDRAFLNCESLNAVYISDLTAWCSISFFSNSYATATGNPLQMAHNLYLNGVIQTDLILPDDVVNISKYAFQGATCIKTVTIPKSLKTIANPAFLDCDSLTTIVWNAISKDDEKYASSSPFSYSPVSSFTFGNEVTHIPNYLCFGLELLKTIHIPNSVTSIGSYAFHSCTGLTSITCEAINPPALGNEVFAEVNKRIPLYVPDGSVNDYKAADQWKDFYIRPISTRPQGMENIHTGKSQTTKVAKDGQILILRGEKTYTLQGQEVK